jgi:hypothetical protein
LPLLALLGGRSPQQQQQQQQQPQQPQPVQIEPTPFDELYTPYASDDFDAILETMRGSYGRG